MNLLDRIDSFVAQPWSTNFTPVSPARLAHACRLIVEQLGAVADRWATALGRALPGRSPRPIGPLLFLPSTYPADRAAAAGRLLVDILVQDALDFLKGDRS